MKRVMLMAVLAFACESAQPAAVSSAWEERSPMNVPRSEMPAVVAGDQIYVLGGLTSASLGTGVSAVVERYDPGADTWQRLAELPEARHHLMAATVDGLIYAIGGYDAAGFNPVASVWVYQPGADEWSSRADLPYAAGAGAAVVFDGLIYVIGGVPSGSGLLIYDPMLDSWTESVSMTQPREHLAGAAVEGNIIALGGRWEDQMLATVETFHPGSGRWSEGPSMSEARSGFGAATVMGSLVVAGGEVFNPAETLDSAERLSGGSWEPLDQLPVPLHGVPLVSVGDTVYVLGGSRQAGGVDNSGQVWSLVLPP